MSELHLQDKFLVPFIKSELGYREVKPNTVTSSLIVEEDLQEFISSTTLNANGREYQISNDNRQPAKLLIVPLTLNFANSPIVISTISTLFDTTLLFLLNRANQCRLSELFLSIFFVSLFVAT